MNGIYNIHHLNIMQTFKKIAFELYGSCAYKYVTLVLELLGMVWAVDTALSSPSESV